MSAVPAAAGPLSTAALKWAGETFALLHERAVWWPARRTLIIADLHLGKPAAFRAAGVPVPEAVTNADLARLTRAVARTAAARLIVLGDLIHAPQGRCPETMDRVHAWRAGHPSVDMTLVRGNHDRRAGDPPPAWGIRCVNPPLNEGPIAFLHEPWEDPGGLPVMAGHIHPCVHLRGGVGGSLRAPCFWFAARAAVLPAFGGFTGCARIRPAPGDRVFLVGPDCVQEAAIARKATRLAGR